MCSHTERTPSPAKTLMLWDIEHSAPLMDRRIRCQTAGLNYRRYRIAAILDVLLNTPNQFPTPVMEYLPFEFLSDDVLLQTDGDPRECHHQ